MSKVKFLVSKDYYAKGILYKKKKGDIAELPEYLETAFLEQKACEKTKEDEPPKGPTLTDGAKELLKLYPDLDLSKIGQDKLDKKEIEKYIKDNKIEPKK